MRIEPKEGIDYIWFDKIDYHDANRVVLGSYIFLTARAAVPLHAIVGIESLLKDPFKYLVVKEKEKTIRIKIGHELMLQLLDIWNIWKEEQNTRQMEVDQNGIPE